jgi:hypothetical protein
MYVRGGVLRRAFPASLHLECRDNVFVARRRLDSLHGDHPACEHSSRLTKVDRQRLGLGTHASAGRIRAEDHGQKKEAPYSGRHHAYLACTDNTRLSCGRRLKKPRAATGRQGAHPSPPVSFKRLLGALIFKQQPVSCGIWVIGIQGERLLKQRPALLAATNAQIGTPEW